LKVRSTSILPFLGFLIAVSLMSPKYLNAQAPPGPLAPAQSQEESPAQPPQAAAKPKQPQVPPRTTLAGPWKLNRDESDDPQQRVRAAEGSGNGNAGGHQGGGNPGGYPGGYPGRGPGGGYPYPGGGGGGPYGGRRSTGQDIEDNPKMQPLIQPSEYLSIELKNPEVDVTDDQSHKLILYTDGRQLQKSTDNNHQEVAAHWNGSQLVTDEKSPLGGKMSRTFELSQDGRKFYETLRIDNGRSKSPLVIQYAYDVATSDMQTGQESDPNRPVLKRLPDGSGNSPQ